VTRGATDARVTLALDASTYVGTVAVLRGRALAAHGDARMRGEDEERLLPAVVATLHAAGCTVPDVARVVCGGGPGSFTSLRIAAAIAKGIAAGNSAVRDEDVPLYPVSSLALIVAGARPALAPGRYVALLDAMRGERYAAVYDVGADGAVRDVERLGRIAEGGIAAECARFGARAIGPRESLAFAPHAHGVAALLDQVIAGGPVPLDGWEPDYGRLAEAQVKWEAAHGRPLSSA
jgi:tRNA threonylcarbamoyladenosine biosynthesis protein TsaB